jgi:DUF1680 family protein
MKKGCSTLKASRREFVRGCALTMAGAACGWVLPRAFDGSAAHEPLREFGYGDVLLKSERHEAQLHETLAVLMELNEDGLLKPFRQMAGQAAPGPDLGGWYVYNPDYDYHKHDAGFAPGSTFGQWVSALARGYAISGTPEIRQKVLRLNRLYAQTISGEFYRKTRFPAYSYDKLVCGLIDAHQFAQDAQAFPILKHTTEVAMPQLPSRAVERGTVWRPGTDESFTWDESYTLPENLFLAYQRGAGGQFRKLGQQFLDASYYDPLAEGRNVLAGRHAYSYVNALCSAMQAYLTLASARYLQAARNAFAMLQEQSFATGGWGPDEKLRAPGSPDLLESLTRTHNSFETPCGAYAHFKLTRALLRVTRDPRYGDSMESVMYNTVLGAKPLRADGQAFYYSDYSFHGRKVYSNHRWPCCSGTLPQVAADYRISTYFQSPGGVFVNLYVPSEASWTQGEARITLTQKSAYPFDEIVEFEITATKAREFALWFRIPSWADGASLAASGVRSTIEATPGTFAEIRRTWKSGDRVELHLPQKLRLQPLDRRHPETVALLSGPMVLFPIGEEAGPWRRERLLAARKSAPEEWTVKTTRGPLRMLPFIAIEDQPYSTYLRLA